QPGQVAVHERRDVDARERARMVPEREARVDLEQIQAPVRTALEIELGDAADTEPPHDVTTQGRDVGRIRDDQRGAVTILQRVRADLASREVGDPVAGRIYVHVIALDERLRADRKSVV